MTNPTTPEELAAELVSNYGATEIEEAGRERLETWASNTIAEYDAKWAPGLASQIAALALDIAAERLAAREGAL